MDKEKKKYIAPQMEVIDLEIENGILISASALQEEDWNIQQ